MINRKKDASSPKILLKIVSTNTEFILKVCRIKPFMSGLESIPIL